MCSLGQISLQSQKYVLLLSLLLYFILLLCMWLSGDMFIFWQTDEDVDWTAIKHNVSETITKFFESGDPITTGAVYNESSEYASTPY